MFVLTIDQRDSRSGTDEVPMLLAALAEVPVVLPFTRTVGDEVQGVLDDAAAVAAAARITWRAGQWSMGLGVGAVEEPLPHSPAAARGEAFIHARAAVEDAKQRPRPVRVIGDPRRASAWTLSETLLLLFYDAVRTPTAAQWRVIDALNRAPGTRQTDVAAALNVTQQYVSKITQTGTPDLVMRAEKACAQILADCAALPPGDPGEE